MTASGRKRKSETVDFEQFERPLLRKADIQQIAPQILPANVRYAVESGHWGGRVLKGR
jgi:hypothetical protein